MKNDDAINLSLKVNEKLKTHRTPSRILTATGSKKTFIISLLFMACITFAFSRLVGPEEKIPSLLEQFGQKYPQEKVHLHLDRNYFATGDTLRFKAYVVNSENNQLANLSKVLYIDLLNTKDSGTLALRFPLTDGTTSGAIAFPDTLKEGTYTLRAYTNWMRNFGQDFFYRAILKIGSTKNPQSETATKSRQNLHEVTFFPEGGDLVNGLTSVIAFKATDGKEKGEDVSGTITDGSGKVLVNFQSTFSGMGRFTLKPLAGKHYNAVVRFKDGTTKKIALPKALASGYVLTIDNQDKTNVSVQIGYTGPQTSDAVWLVSQANNKLISITETTLSNGSANLLLPKRKFPEGIAQLTLFDKFSQPRAERLIFSDRHDQLRLNLTIQKVSTQHTTLKIPLEVTDHLANPLNGSFSVAVVNKSGITDSAAIMPSILANLLLTSDLKGNIENPDYYFRDRSLATALKLDNLMLTQGWRRFIWQDLLAGKSPQIIYPAEKEQTLCGRVQTLKGSALPHLNLLLTSKGDSAFTLRASTDNDGRFTFQLPHIEGPQQLSIIASTEKTRNDVNIILDQFAPSNPSQLTPTSAQTTDQGQLLTAYLATKPQFAPSPALSAGNQTRQLKEVVVKSKKLSLTEKAVAPSGNLNGPGNANQVVTYKDLNHCSNLEICLLGKLVGVYFKTVKDPNSHSYKKVPYSTTGFNKPMLFVLDGVPMQPDQISLNSIPIGDVQSIEVLRTGALLAVYGIAGSGGVLVITTKRGGIDYNQTDEQESKPANEVPGIINIIYSGFQKRREFYTPQYTSRDNKNIISPETVFWNPAVQTNDEGKAVIEFSAGSNIKKFAVIIEGISTDGKIGYKYQEFDNN